MLFHNIEVFVAGDIYKERYERTRREMELGRKRLELEKEEEAEKYETSRKHLERKVRFSGRLKFARS